MTYLYMLCGVPGSGKSTFARSFSFNVKSEYISRDEIRFKILKEDEDYFSHEDEVVTIFHNRIADLLKNNINVIADATHNTKKARFNFLHALETLGVNFEEVNIIPIYMNTSLENCLINNKKRTGKACVPDDVVMRMYNASQKPNYNEHYNYYHIIYRKYIEQEVINNA